MRVGLGARYCLGVWLLSGLGCKSRLEPDVVAVEASAKPPSPLVSIERAPRPVSSEVLAVRRHLQSSKLRPPPWRAHRAQLAFGKGVFAQLGEDALRIFADDEPRLLVTEPVHGPRALLALPDGSLLAFDSERMLRWEPGWKRAKASRRPFLLPNAELYADPQRADVFWVFEPKLGSSPARLISFPLAASDALLPAAEQTIELSAGSAGVLGFTREGVWLYLTEGQVERFAPGGARLAPLRHPEISPPTWALPALRLDQSLWLTETGELSRVQVSPSFRRLSKLALPGTAFAAGVGDHGRLTAVVLITGDGPRFELELLDAALEPSARVVLPAESPTGRDDWVQVVTQNQQLALSPRTARVAVGGPGRASIYDASGNVIFTIPSR